MIASTKHTLVFRTILLSVIACLILATPKTFAATNVVQLYVLPSSTSVAVGSTVTIQIRLGKDSNSRVDYANAIVSYPAQLFEVTNISTSGNPFTDNGGPTTTYSNSAGSLQVRGSGATLTIQADVVIASVTFRAKAAGNAAVTFSSNSQVGNLLGGGNVKDYLTGTSPGSITVVQPSTVASKPSTAPVSPTANTTPPQNGADIPPGTQEPPVGSQVINDTETPSSLLTTPNRPSGLLTAFWVDITLAVVSLTIAGTLFVLRKRLHLDRIPPRVSQSLGSLFPKVSATTDAPADTKEASAILASSTSPTHDAHPSIHSIETTQQHPTQPGAKPKPKPHPAVLSHDTAKQVVPDDDDDIIMPAINTVHASTKPKPQIIRPDPKPEPTPKPVLKPEPSKPPEPLHDPRVTVPTAEQLAALPDDMFEAGAKRLELEGLDKPMPPSRQNPGNR